MITKKHSGEIDLFRRVTKEGEHERYGFQRIHEHESVFHNPTLLCCGGIFSNAHEADGKKGSNAYARMGHGLLGFPDAFPISRLANYKPNIDIVSVCYPENSESLMAKHHQYVNELNTENPAVPTQFARNFTERHFFPLISQTDGTPLPVDTIRRNLRKIQVLAHSYGSTFIQQVGDVLYDRLAELHFSPEQIRDVTSQVLVVTAGPITPPATGKASFTTVNVINIDDREIRNSYNAESALQELFLATNMLVDRKNRPVSKIDPQSHYDYFPAKPLNIMPVTTTRTSDAHFHMARSAQSNQWVVCLSQPLFLNGLGDIIHVPAIPAHERSNARGAFDGSQSSFADETQHQDITYFTAKRQQSGIVPGPREHLEHATTPRALISSVLINGMNNALRNEHSEQFIPLGTADALMQLPLHTEYTTALDVPFRHVARLDNYDLKLAQGLDAGRPSQNEREI